MFLHCTPDRNSLRSRSPEDNSSLLSASAGSLDSALNHSREEEELKNLTLDSSHDDVVHPSSDIGLIKQSVSPSGVNNCWSDEAEAVQHPNNIIDIHNHRNSNESGFVSIRSSTQSMSTKHVASSIVAQQQSTISSMQASSAAAAITNVIRKFDAISEQNTIATTASSTSSFTVVDNESSLSTNVIDSQMSKTLVSKTSITAKEVTDGMEALNVNIDEVFGTITEEKPPLPEKTRKSSVRRISTYDNVDETDTAELR